MEFRKAYIPTVCNTIQCPFFGTCAKGQTELAYTRNDETIDLLFVGMGLGEVEAKTKHPFTGPAGKLLREKLLPIISSKRLNIMLDNTIRCRPLDERNKNRAPTQEEVSYCLPILWTRIQQFKPGVVITLGASATGDMISITYKRPISSVRGRKYTVNGFTFIPTFHPAAILHCGDQVKIQEYHSKMNQDIMLAIAQLSGQMVLI